MLRELVRLAELNATESMAEPAFQAAASSLRVQLRTHSTRVQELELLAAEQDRPADAEEAMRHVNRHRKEGITLQASLRDLARKVRASRAQQEAAERSSLLFDATSSADSSRLSHRKMSDRAAAQVRGSRQA